jgi:hypothetical protein
MQIKMPSKSLKNVKNETFNICFNGLSNLRRFDPKPARVCIQVCAGLNTYHGGFELAFARVGFWRSGQ